MNPRFHPVIRLPEGTPVLDLSGGGNGAPEKKDGAWGIGRYDEIRPGIYTTPLFGGVRNIHVGIDLFAPVGTPIHAFDDGWIHLFGYNGAAGDYGYTLITRHRIDGREIYALHGHLARETLERQDGRIPREGQPVARGDVIAWVGDRHENGGWPPHLHFQLSIERPEVPDMPGVVSREQHAEALIRYPDPRLVLGPLY